MGGRKGTTAQQSGSIVVDTRKAGNFSVRYSSSEAKYRVEEEEGRLNKVGVTLLRLRSEKGAEHWVPSAYLGRTWSPFLV